MTKKSVIRIFMVAAAAVGAMLLSAVSVCAAEYYVDGSLGDDSQKGAADAPFKTIQHAADIVQPGDTVIIRPGVYYEHVTLKTNGTEENPIVFKASEYGEGKVIITGANREIREKIKKWDLVDKELGLYSIDFDHAIYRMTADDVQVVQYRSLRGLKTFICNASDPSETNPEGSAGYMHGYEHGYYWSAAEQKLYVRLGNDGCIAANDPNQAVIDVAADATANGVTIDGVKYTGQIQSAILGTQSYLFGVTTEASAHVFISGITFRMPAVAAVWARCSDLTVSNCWFIGCIEGVRGGCRATSDTSYLSKNITIEYCYYTNYPIYTDAIKTIVNYADDPAARGITVDEEGNLPLNSAGKVKGGNTLYYWHSKNYLSVNYEGGGLVTYMGENWTLRYNHFYDVLDALSSAVNFSYWQPYVYNGSSSSRQTPAKNVRIIGNRFENCLDNAIEFEDNVQGMEVAYNEFIGQMDPFSWQPLSGFPYPTNINVHHNILWGTQEEGWMWYHDINYIKGKKLASPRYSAMFKLGANQSDLTNLSWMKEAALPLNASGAPIDGTVLGDDGMRVWNNTFIFPNMAFEENVGILGGGPDKDCNIKFTNNLIQVIVTAEDNTFKGGFVKGQAYTTARDVQFDHNMLISGLDIDKAKEIGDITVSKPAAEASSRDAIVQNGGSYVDDIDKVGFADWRNGNFALTENSIARGKGVQIEGVSEKTTDLGALQYGETWHVTVGPFAELDINADGTIDMSDVVEVGRNVGMEDFNVRADLDRNGRVDEKDLQLMLNRYRNGGEDA